MQHARTLIVPCSLLLGIPAVFAPAFGGPPAQNLPEARPAPLYNPVSRCPRVRIADEGTIAVVAFVVGSTGVPSQGSISRSSQSKDLDDAALECVMKLRYLPSVRVGEGTPMDTWQQLGWRWTQQPQAGAAAGTAAAGAAVAGAAVDAPIAAAAGSGGTPAVRPVELRVCADQAGRLSQDPTIVQSSGDPGLDQAAVRIAKSGSGNYRPAETLNGKPVSGCAQLSIRFE